MINYKLKKDFVTNIAYELGDIYFDSSNYSCEFFGLVRTIYYMIKKYDSIDLVINSLHYAKKNDIANLEDACDIIYKSQTLRG